MAARDDMSTYGAFSYSKSRVKRSKKPEEGGKTLTDFDAANDRHDRLVAAREERARRREAGNGVRPLEHQAD